MVVNNVGPSDATNATVVDNFPTGGADGNAQFGIVADFDDVDGWRRYVAHPAHVAVLRDRIRPILATRTAVQVELDP